MTLLSILEVTSIENIHPHYKCAVSTAEGRLFFEANFLNGLATQLQMIVFAPRFLHIIMQF